MRNFQPNRRWRNIFESPPFLIFLSIVLLFFIWTVISFFNKMELTIKNRKLAEAKVAELEAQKTKFESDIAKLSTDEGKEESIRERFPVAKAGEGLIVVVDDKNAALSQEASTGGFISFLRKLFK